MVDVSRLVGWLAAEWAQGGHRGMLGLFFVNDGGWWRKRVIRIYGEIR